MERHFLHGYFTWESSNNFWNEMNIVCQKRFYFYFLWSLALFIITKSLTKVYDSSPFSVLKGKGGRRGRCLYKNTIILSYNIKTNNTIISLLERKRLGNEIFPGHYENISSALSPLLVLNFLYCISNILIFWKGATL